MHSGDRKFVVTGGPTREWLDPVRFISNPSSGKMGIAIADEAFMRGCETVFIHGPIDPSLVRDRGYRTVPVESTADLLEAVMAEITERSVLIMAAAPADYTAEERSERKIKKGGDSITLRLKRTPDILKTIAGMKAAGDIRELFTVGFAAETDNLTEYALNKLREKDLDMICLNDVSAQGAGFGADTNIVTIFARDGTSTTLPMLSKREVAKEILDRVELMLLS